MDDLGAVETHTAELDQAQPVEELVEALYRISIGEAVLFGTMQQWP